MARSREATAPGHAGFGTFGLAHDDGLLQRNAGAIATTSRTAREWRTRLGRSECGLERVRHLLWDTARVALPASGHFGGSEDDGLAVRESSVVLSAAFDQSSCLASDPEIMSQSFPLGPLITSDGKWYLSI